MTMEKSWTFHDALRAVLLFYQPGPWNAGRRKEWARITGTEVVNTTVLCDHIGWIVGGGGTFGYHPVNGSTEGPGERLWGLSAGHVLTEQDVADIQEVVSDHNEELGESANAYHLGGRDMLKRIGGDDLVNVVETNDEMQQSKIVDAAMAKFRSLCAAQRHS